MGKDLFNDRISRFSIRKLNVGVCSVLLGTLVMVGTAASAAAEENTDTTSESVAAVAPASEASTATATSAASTAVTTSTYDAKPAVTAPVTSTEPATSTAPASTSATSSTSTAASAVSTAPATSTAAATPSLEATTPTNKAPEVASTTTDKKEEIAAGVEAPAGTATPSTEETRGRRRTRRALGDANDPNLIGDDVEDATSTPKEAKPGFTTDVDAKSMTSQIAWLDFGDVANWTGAKTIKVAKNEMKPNELTESLALQVGLPIPRKSCLVM